MRTFEMPVRYLGGLYALLTEYCGTYGMGPNDPTLLDDVMNNLQRVAAKYHEDAALPAIKDYQGRGAGRRPVCTEEEQNRILEMRSQGKTIREIASTVSHSVGYVQKIINEQKHPFKDDARIAVFEVCLDEDLAQCDENETVVDNKPEMRISDLGELYILLRMYVQSYERNGHADELMHEVQYRFNALSGTSQEQNPRVTITNARGAGRHSTHTQQERDLILELRDQGKTYREIASAVKCPLSYVQKVIAEHRSYSE